MPSGELNEEILRAIKDNAEGDEAIAEFLTEMLIEEANHTKRWWAGREYRKQIAKHIRDWEGADED